MASTAPMKITNLAAMVTDRRAPLALSTRDSPYRANLGLVPGAIRRPGKPRANPPSVSRRSWDGVAEPDADRGDVDGAAPNKVAFVELGGDGPVLAELADGPFDGVALLVDGRVEGRWSAALAAPAGASWRPGQRARQCCLDAAPAQVSPGPALEYTLSPSVRPGGSGDGQGPADDLEPVQERQKARESSRCPALVTAASGQHRESAAR